MDTIDAPFRRGMAANLETELNGRRPDYLVVQHMEPDHSANIAVFMETYPEAQIVSSAKAFVMMQQFFGTDFPERKVVVGEGELRSKLGRHTLTFVTAPMVHWAGGYRHMRHADKVLFSADGFGRFGALDVGRLGERSPRCYIGIVVGKYGAWWCRRSLKAAALDIAIICPLQPVLNENLHILINTTHGRPTRSRTSGVVIAYTSVYGHTKEARRSLPAEQRGCPNVVVADLARCDMAESRCRCVPSNKLVLATTTYNATIFPHMQSFIDHLTARNYQGRTVGMIENGAWAPMAAKVMKKMLETSKNLTYTDTTVTVKCALNDASRAQIDALADELCK